MVTELDRYFDAWKRERVEASTEYLQGEASELEHWLRTPGTPPWQDRTSDARQGLYVTISPVKGSHGYWTYDVEMGYQVQYGYWLELKRYDAFESPESKMERAGRVIAGFATGDEVGQATWGRDAILLPTMPAFMRSLQRGLQDVWSVGNVYSYAPRWSTVAGTAYAGQRAPGGDEGYGDTGTGRARRGYSGSSYMPESGDPYESPRDFWGDR